MPMGSCGVCGVEGWWCGLICRKAWRGLLCLHSLSVSTSHTPVFSLTLACISLESSAEERVQGGQDSLECIRSCHQIVWSLETGSGGEGFSLVMVMGQLSRSTAWSGVGAGGGTWSWDHDSKSHDSIAGSLALLSSCQEFGLMDSTRNRTQIIRGFQLEDSMGWKAALQCLTGKLWKNVHRMETPALLQL